MTKWLFFPIFFIVFLPSIKGIGKENSSYQTAKVISINQSTVTRSRYVGESFGEVQFMTSKPYQAVVYEMMLEVDGDRHCLFYDGRSTKDISQIQTGDLLEVRMKADKASIRFPPGNKLKTRLVSCPHPAE